MTIKPLPDTGNHARVERYRRTHRRIDYVAAADVVAIIEQHLVAGLDNCRSGVLDMLIRAGHEAMSGNGSGSRSVG